MLLTIERIERALFSTRVTDSAPRESASNPSAPDPAKKSTTRAPGMSSCRMLIHASRTRSRVGRTSSPAGASILLPRHFPATMRTWSAARDYVCDLSLQTTFSPELIALETERDVDFLSLL